MGVAQKFVSLSLAVHKAKTSLYTVKRHNNVRCALPIMDLLIMEFSRAPILDATWRQRHLQNFGTRAMQKQKFWYPCNAETKIMFLHTSRLGIRNSNSLSIYQKCQDNTSMKIGVFCDVRFRQLVKSYPRFGGFCCFHF